MNLLKSLGFGAIIYGVAFIVASAFIGFGITSENSLVQGVTMLAVSTAAFLLAKNLNFADSNEMLKYSFSWVIVGLILDALITTRFTGWEFFYRLDIWLSYALILLVPLLALKPKEKSE